MTNNMKGINEDWLAAGFGLLVFVLALGAPRFILGYIVTFVVILMLAVGATPEMTGKLKSAMAEANTLRAIFS